MENSKLTEYLNSLNWDRKDYTIGHLLEAFSAAGFPKDRSWIYRQEGKGNLIMPVSPTEYKKARGTRKVGFVRQMSPKMIADIVTAMTPGGAGYYDYKKDTNTE